MSTAGEVAGRAWKATAVLTWAVLGVIAPIVLWAEASNLDSVADERQERISDVAEGRAACVQSIGYVSYLPLRPYERAMPTDECMSLQRDRVAGGRSEAMTFRWVAIAMLVLAPLLIFAIYRVVRWVASGG